MEGATHFIEVWRDFIGVRNGPMLRISGLQETLRETASRNTLSTIAVWKIKLKP